MSDLKESLMNTINSDKDVDMELKNLMDYTSKNQMIKEFSDKLFESFVKEVVALDRKKFEFRLKCGLSLVEEIKK